MSQHQRPHNSDSSATSGLARAIRTFAQTNGDHATAVPALTLHRRTAPTEPLHCIYHLGLGVVAQGGKQVILGSESLSYMPGQSMLTTIDLPVVSHVTHATSREPFLGMMLRLDARTILQLAAEMDAPRRRRDAVYRTVSIETLGADLLDAPPALSQHHWREPVAVPETVASTRSATVDAEREPRRGQRCRTSWLRKPLAVQPGVQSPVWRPASARCQPHAARPGTGLSGRCWVRTLRVKLEHFPTCRRRCSTSSSSTGSCADRRAQLTRTLLRSCGIVRPTCGPPSPNIDPVQRARRRAATSAYASSSSGT